MSSNIQISRVCESCKADFIAKTTRTRFCSKKCTSAVYKQKHTEAKIEKSNAETAASKILPIVEIMLKTYYSIEDLCKIFGLSRRTVYRIIERGELQHAKLGGKTFVHKETIENLFKKEK